MGPAALLRAQAGSLDVGAPLGKGTRARNPGVRLAGGPGRTQPNQAAEEGGTEAGAGTPRGRAQEHPGVPREGPPCREPSPSTARTAAGGPGRARPRAWDAVEPKQPGGGTGVRRAPSQGAPKRPQTRRGSGEPLPPGPKHGRGGIIPERARGSTAEEGPTQDQHRPRGKTGGSASPGARDGRSRTRPPRKETEAGAGTPRGRAQEHPGVPREDPPRREPSPSTARTAADGPGRARPRARDAGEASSQWGNPGPPPRSVAKWRWNGADTAPVAIPLCQRTRVATRSTECCHMALQRR